ncbi:MAG TPA: alcohol dehydrogenase [Anaerolineaceae bacterium]|nr:MAG: Iron-containing alcohol dehydrogenase [Anaerolineaceae bacterium 46_22]HAF47618.1 alcohol dehydrogenase [Anaerolineaceae bacterium]
MALGKNFEFVTSEKIVFGNGTLVQVKESAKEFGRKVLLVCGSGSVPTHNLINFLEEGDLSYEIFRVEGEPNISTIEDGLSRAKSSGSTFVIGYGGGSVLDAAKAISAMMTNQGELMDYLEVIGRGKKITNSPAPMIAIPTTAGTGTEVTRNAVITSEVHHVKVSIRSPLMIPKLAIVDPELTMTMPPSVTASTGMDALTQVIEGYVSNKANPMTDALAKEGILRGSRALLNAFQNGSDLQARYDMSLTSLFGGLVLGNSGLGAVHGFAGPIGGMFNAPHGAICASLLPAVMKFNALEISQRGDMEVVQKKFVEIAQWITGKPNASINEGIVWIENLARQLNIPGLKATGIKRSDFGSIIEKASISSSMQKNPVKLDTDTLLRILEEAY